ncbi:3-hydroxyacyl-CoA dehydrogenase [Aphelenchoides avenae]|nr:3-hydroxyacyl-CoA dehydrogenase [Aphelenchus avenae]
MFSASIITRGLSSSAALNAAIKNVTVIGSGLMGAGIAQVSAQSNLNVTLVDQNQQILDKARKGIEKSAQRVVAKKFKDDEAGAKKAVETLLGNIKFTPNVEEGVSKADLVIEAIAENVEAKRKLFTQVEGAVPSKTLLTTNTSSLRLEDIGKNIKRKAQFGGLHFFNPVPVMKLLEVVRFAQTSDETFNSLIEYGKSVGKVTVACKDTPGFIVNRLLVPYMLEAVRMSERGDASKEDIDTAMKLGASYPMGPFELMDYVGLDTCKFIIEGWHEQYPDEVLFKPSPLLNKLVSEGKLGRKSGEGFYKYN